MVDLLGIDTRKIYILVYQNNFDGFRLWLIFKEKYIYWDN